MVKSVTLIAVLIFFTADSMRIHRTSITDFITHDGVPSLFRKVNPDSDEFEKIARDQLNKINSASVVISD
jgi:hypothetical protein